MHGSSVTVLMFAAGIEAMNKVIDLANEMTAQQRQESLFGFISGILMIFPGVIPASIAIDQFGLKELMAVLGPLANPAMLLYEATHSPEVQNVLWQIKEEGPDNKAIGDAAKRRPFVEEDYTVVGASTRRHLDMIHFTQCRRRGH